MGIVPPPPPWASKERWDRWIRARRIDAVIARITFGIVIACMLATAIMVAWSNVR